MKFLLLVIAVLSIQGNGITKNELLGKFDPAIHPDFVIIDREYTSKPAIYLRKATYTAFVAMHDSAKKEGLDLEIISATRTFNYQRSIWQKKWARTRYMGWEPIEKSKDIMTYSSMPTTSRHHWGTDIDLNSLNNEFFESGYGKKLYSWLQANAANFGFRQVYTDKSSGRTGYNEEKWHWSYFPLSDEYLEEYERLVSYDDIVGFDGHETAREVKAIEHYVRGIE